jgi:hypothetical protein
VNVAEVRSKIPKQRDRCEAMINVHPALAARLNFAIEQQFGGIFCGSGIEPRLLQHLAGLRADFKHPGNARPLLAGSDHFARCPPAEQKSERVHNNRLAASRLAGEQIQAWVKSNPKAVDYGIIFNHQFVQHSIRL